MVISSDDEDDQLDGSANKKRKLDHYSGFMDDDPFSRSTYFGMNNNNNNNALPTNHNNNNNNNNNNNHTTNHTGNGVIKTEVTLGGDAQKPKSPKQSKSIQKIQCFTILDSSDEEREREKSTAPRVVQMPQPSESKVEASSGPKSPNTNGFHDSALDYFRSRGVRKSTGGMNTSLSTTNADSDSATNTTTTTTSTSASTSKSTSTSTSSSSTPSFSDPATVSSDSTPTAEPTKPSKSSKSSIKHYFSNENTPTASKGSHLRNSTDGASSKSKSTPPTSTTTTTTTTTTTSSNSNLSSSGDTLTDKAVKKKVPVRKHKTTAKPRSKQQRSPSPDPQYPYEDDKPPYEPPPPEENNKLSDHKRVNGKQKVTPPSTPIPNLTTSTTTTTTTTSTASISPENQRLSFMYNVDSQTIKYMKHLLPENVAKPFPEDFYSSTWMEWRASIETGEILTDVDTIHEVERELAAKYKVLSPTFNIFVFYAVAFVLGRHMDYVKAIWRTLPDDLSVLLPKPPAKVPPPVVGSSYNPITLDDDDDDAGPSTKQQNLESQSNFDRMGQEPTIPRRPPSPIPDLDEEIASVVGTLSQVPEGTFEDASLRPKVKTAFLDKGRLVKKSKPVRSRTRNTRKYSALLQNTLEETIRLTMKAVPVVAEISSSEGAPIIEDASHGTFPHPVKVYNNVDKEKFPDYIQWEVENKYSLAVQAILQEAGDVDAFGTGCSCEGACKPNSCQCMLEMQTHPRPRAPYTATGKLTLSPGLPIYECNSHCFCSANCQNRLIQKGSKAQLEIFKTPRKGWGVRASEEIKAGTFVCEYIGEIITTKEADERGKEYDKQKQSYLYDLDFADEVMYVIDAYYVGNVARFINHSCDPNLQNMQFWVSHHELSMPRVAFFAKRNQVVEGGDGDNQDSILCQCGREGAHRLY